MNGLRWSLVVVTALAAAGWLLIAAWGKGFRRSFGASEVSWAVGVLPVLVLGVLLASLLLPGNAALLHVVAVVVVLLAVVSVRQFPKFSGAGSMGLIYSG